MKKIIALLASLIVLTPAFAMAQAPEQRPLRAEIRGDGKAGMHASSTKPLTPGSLPKLGPAVRGIASTTRGEAVDIASSTLELVKTRVGAIKNLIDKKRADMKQRAEEARGKARERFGERVETLVGNVSARLASTSAHLDSIADRIDTRIDTLQDQGYDMEDSIKLLATARTDLSIANDRILAVNAALEAAMSTTTPKSEMQKVRTTVKAAEDALKLVKDDLMNTLRSVKVDAGATTTTQ